MDIQLLINFISKLNDRNLQKQQVYGFTLWAILAVSAYLLFDIIDKIQQINSNPYEKFYFLIILALFSDFSYLLLMLGNSINKLSESSRIRRFTSTIDSIFSISILIPFFLIIIIFSVINFKTAELLTTSEVSTIFWIFSIFFAIIGISIIIEKMDQLNKNYRQKSSFPKISSFTRKKRLSISIISILISLFGLLLLYIACSNILVSLDNEQIQIPLLLKTSIEIIGLLALILIFFNQLSIINKNKWLENLEIEIFLEKLTEKEIESKLEKEYFGLNIYKWIANLDGKLQEAGEIYCKTSREEKKKIDEKYQEIENLDQIKQISEKNRIIQEYIDTTNDVLIRLKKANSDYYYKCIEVGFQFNEIFKQGLDQKESDEINTVYIKWKNQADKIQKNDDEFMVESEGKIKDLNNFISKLKE